MTFKSHVGAYLAAATILAASPIPTAAQESRAVLTRLPFVTHFDSGGRDLPRGWRPTIARDVGGLTPKLDPREAYHGTGSLAISGRLDAPSRIPLFETRLLIGPETRLSITFKTGTDDAASRVRLALTFAEAPGRITHMDVGSTERARWETRRFRLAPFAGQTLTSLGLTLESPQPVPSYMIHIGRLAVFDGPVDPGASDAASRDDVETSAMLPADAVPGDAAGSRTAIAATPVGSLVNYVNTLRGTQNDGAGYSRGNTFPAALRPWGFNFWTPITEADSDRWLYDYDARRIAGFSISHEPSPWIGDYGAIQFFPQTGTAVVSPGGRAASFTHANEIARPHYYSVRFDNGIRTEIAPTDHAAKVRFTFPAGNAYVTFDAVSSSDRGGRVGYSGNAVHGFSTLRGERLYFYARFDRTFSNPDVDGDPGRPLWGSVQFAGGQAVVMDIGTSFISVPQAKRNLEGELGPTPASKTFASALSESETAWNTELGRFQLGEADDADRFTTFYSNLYRSLMYPNSRWEKDASGNATYCSPFVDFAQPACSGDPLSDPACRCPSSAIKTGIGTGDPAGGNRGKMYVNNGFWDTYHAEWPLLTLVYPQQAAQMLQGFINTYLDGGWSARWTGPGYQHSMLGTLTDVVWADAYVKGVISPANANIDAMYEAMVKDATVVAPDGVRGRQGNDHSIFTGWVAQDRVGESGSWHLEDRNNDWGLAQVARLLGRTTEAAYFRDRALDYVNLFSPTAADKPLGGCASARDTAATPCGTGTTATGFFRGRNLDGSWRQSDAAFYPQEWGHEFSEGAPWHYSLAAAHDPQGMANLYGGRAAMAARIDALFAADRNYKHGGYGGTIHEMAEAWDANTGQYAHINEPIHNTLYMYNYAGQPAKTARRVRDVLDTQYVSGLAPGEGGHGYRGDEDNGEMSAWYVLSAAGLFPAAPAHPIWTIGTPLFSSIRIAPQGGTPFTICTGAGASCTVDASHLSGASRYVDSARLVGTPLSRSYLTHAEVRGGGTLVLSMTSRDTSSWGTAASDLPPSITTGTTPPSPAPDRASRGTSSASTSLNANEDHTRAFDDTSSTKWLANTPTGWIQYQFPDSQAHRVDTYTLTSANDAAGRDPRDWSLLGSNDGATWTTLDTETAQTWPWRRQTRVFGVSRPGAYRHYRLDVRANNGEGMLQIAEIELLNLDTTSGSAAVRIFQHCDYGGWAAAFDAAGTVSRAQILGAGGQDDDASSIRIAPGYKVTLYDGDAQSGRAIVLTSDTPCLVANGFNDVLTSMKIESAAGPEPGVVFYEHASFTGAASQALPPGDYTLSQLVARGIANDAASSVRVPAGRTVTLFEHDNFSGQSWTLTSDTPYLPGLTPNANDAMSSCRVR